MEKEIRELIEQIERRRKEIEGTEPESVSQASRLRGEAEAYIQISYRLKAILVKARCAGKSGK